ncbi:MAG: alpha/beta hydrolase [Candidatus Hodarchaeales archaeon]
MTAIPFVPTDLLEYPLINYFQYRNRGKLNDLALNKTLVEQYNAYRSRPKEFFIKGMDLPLKKFKWSRTDAINYFTRKTGESETPYKPLVNGVLKNSKFYPCNFIRIHQYRHKKIKSRPKSAVLFIHGFAENTFKFHELGYFSVLSRKFKSDIVALELPYHFDRQPTDSSFSGAYFFNGNPIRMIEAYRQSVQEIVMLTKYLQGIYNEVILFGISLGGHLLALVTQFVSKVVIISALSSPFIFNLDPKIVPVSRSIVSNLKKQRHLSWYKILGLPNLKYFQPLTTNESTFIIGGRYDRIVPIQRVQALSNLLQRPLFVFNGGHVSLFFWLDSLLNKIISNKSNPRF